MKKWLSVVLGGVLEMALACDLRIAAEHATFGLPEVRRSLIAAGGGLLRLPRAIPLAKAMEIILLGQRTSAQEALHYGLVNKPPRHALPQECQKTRWQYYSLLHLTEGLLQQVLYSLGNDDE